MYSPEEGRATLASIDFLIADARKHSWFEDNMQFDRPSKTPDFPKLDAAIRRAAEQRRNPGGDYDNEEEEEGDTNPNQRAYGPWAECVVDVSRVPKVMRGGTTVRYRALCIRGESERLWGVRGGQGAFSAECRSSGVS